MSNENGVEFEEYDIEFSDADFSDLSNEELEECKEIINDIKKNILIRL